MYSHVGSCLLIYALLSLGGWVIGSLLDLRTSGVVLAGFGCFILAIGSAILGAILMTGAFSGEIQRINDGKNDILITIQIGPFSYTRKIQTLEKQ